MAWQYPGTSKCLERATILCDSDTFFVEEPWLRPEAEPRVGLQPSLINQEKELIEAARKPVGVLRFRRELAGD
jgi:hypothetical protein